MPTVINFICVEGSTMAIDFQRQRAFFPSVTGRSQSTELVFVFSGNVRKAESAINGYSMGYGNGDHHLLRAQVDTTVTSVSLNTVRVRVDYLLRDSSGNIDDPYDGFVDVTLIADVA
jgi:hypothetical protein